jgi:hypothetical protein
MNASTQARADAKPSLMTSPQDPWIRADPKTFLENFNKKTFEVRHTLSQHPAFQLPALIELAGRMLRTNPQFIHCDTAKLGVGDGAAARENIYLDVVKVMEQIENAGAWLILYHAESDPAYREIFDHGLSDIKRQIGHDIDNDVLEQEIIIFVTSPNRVTHYHIDKNVNFLLQIHGDKTCHVFDRYDREVLTEEEIERNWTVNDKAPPYREHLQNHATTYQLKPGIGCHIPVNAPHWLQNGNNVSVSLSVNFTYKPHLLADIHRMNYFIRRLGVNPTPPGISPMKDKLKALMAPPVVGAARTLWRMRHGDAGADKHTNKMT